MSAEAKRRGRPPGSKNQPGAKAGGPGRGQGRKPKPPSEKLVKLTIAISPAEAVELAEVLSTSGLSQRQAIMAGARAIKASAEYQAKRSEPDPPF